MTRNRKTIASIFAIMAILAISAMQAPQAEAGPRLISWWGGTFASAGGLGTTRYR